MSEQSPDRHSVHTGNHGGGNAEERPPLGTWGRMYALVLLTLALLIGLFYLFTWYFR